MRILYLSQYFPPEVGATQIRAHEMAANLVSLGHQVTVMTEMPNHPSGIIRPEYRRKFRAIETLDGIEVVRSWVYATPYKTFRRRLIFYLSFMITTIFNSLFLERKRFHVVYATSPPLLVGLAGLIIAKLKKIPLVFEVRDLWPESAVELGELTNPKYINWAQKIADLCNEQARGIVTVTRGIYRRLLAKNLTKEKLFLVQNGTNPERYRYTYDSELQKILGWQGKFIVLYVGIHGLAQGLETVIEAASLLKHENSLHFAFVGEGPKKNELMQKAARRKLSNIDFISEVPADEICKYISLADLCLVPLKKNDLFKGALPTKMFDYWACGKPILLSVDGEAREELEGAKGGVFVEPENSSLMAKTILDVYKDPTLAKQMGENGKRYIREKGYIRSEQARVLAHILRKLVLNNVV